MCDFTFRETKTGVTKGKLPVWKQHLGKRGSPACRQVLPGDFPQGRKLSGNPGKGEALGRGRLRQHRKGTSYPGEAHQRYCSSLAGLRHGPFQRHTALPAEWKPRAYPKKTLGPCLSVSPSPFGRPHTLIEMYLHRLFII